MQGCSNKYWEAKVCYLLDKSVYLGEECEEIALTTIGDSAFPRFSGILKSFNRMIDPKERYYNLKLGSVRVLTENAYSMLKRLWKILYKKLK